MNKRILYIGVSILVLLLCLAYAYQDYKQWNIEADEKLSLMDVTNEINDLYSSLGGRNCSIDLIVALEELVNLTKQQEALLPGGFSGAQLGLATVHAKLGYLYELDGNSPNSLQNYEVASRIASGLAEEFINEELMKQMLLASSIGCVIQAN